MTRFFVVGNGASLRDTPLDMLAGEKSVALNRVHLIYPYTKWRPTHYVKTDHNHRLIDVYNSENIFHATQGYKCYFWDRFKDGDPEQKDYQVLPVGMGDWPTVTWIPRCEHHYYHADNYIHKAQSWHLPTICTAFSGISPAIQIAVLEGATEIYLIGCDLGYGKAKGHDHFSTEYSIATHNLGDWDTREVTEAHLLAKRSCPIPIYNATIGGTLDVYERVDLMEVLS